MDDARGHLKSVALAALAVDRLRRRGLLMRQRRERAHASYTARKTKLEAAERADEAAAEIDEYSYSESDGDEGRRNSDTYSVNAYEGPEE